MLGHQEPKWVTTNSLHQLVVDVLWALIWKVGVGEESGHVPARIKREELNNVALPKMVSYQLMHVNITLLIYLFTKFMQELLYLQGG